MCPPANGSNEKNNCNVHGNVQQIYKQFNFHFSGRGQTDDDFDLWPYNVQDINKYR